MIIYFAHNTQFDYQRDWYDIIRSSPIFTEHTCIFPHEHEDMKRNSYPTLQMVDCVIAEASYHSTGMGIELGWAQTLGKPIFCLYQNGLKTSNSLKAVTASITGYSTKVEMITLISSLL